MKIIFLLSLFFITITEISFASKARLPEIITSEVPALKTSKNASHLLSKAIHDFYKLKNKDIIRETFCQSCEKVIDQIIQYRKSGANKQSVIVFLQNLCHVFTDWGPVVCKGYVDIEIDTILYIIDNRDLSPKRVCAIQFQKKGCTDPQVNKWVVDIPPVVKSSKVYHHTHHHEEKSPLKILHLTDFHYDPLYKPGSNADCGIPLCCQKSNGPPSKPENAAGFWGDYHFCDTPWHTITDFMTYLNNEYEKFDYIYYTGDIISHKSWATSKIENEASFRDLFELFKKTFNNTPVFPILGNHEPHPTDFYSPEDVASDSKISTRWIFDIAATEWGRWLPKSTTQTIRKGGYYTLLVKPGFRIVALNSNVCYTSNLWLIYEDQDPYDQLKWLIQVLSQAEQDGEKVHILSHIPPGNIECLQQWSHQFRRIVNRFAPIIMAQFNGHTHLDELRLFYDMNNKKIINVAFNAGSFTTFVGLNPNYRIYDIDPNVYNVLDYDHYTFNLTKANLTPGKSPNWYRLYSFKEAYGLKNTNFTNLAGLVERMSNDDALMEQYYKYQVRESDPQMAKPCDDTCLQKLLCTIVSVESKSALQCL